MQRKEALLANLKTYNTGKPCIKGHFSDRYTSSKHCVQCKTKQAKDWAKENFDAKSDIKKAYRARNKLNIKHKDAEYRKVNAAQIYLVSKKWNAQNKKKCVEYATRNRIKRLDRFPSWVTKMEKVKIASLYDTARKLTVVLGVKHHVDHIIPLRGKKVSGLHVLANLQILTANENMKKSNVYL